MIIRFFLKIKSCDIYVYVYNLKNYTEFFEINILNWYNIFTSSNLKSTIFVEVLNF
jgi:hypothetical protein